MTTDIIGIINAPVAVGVIGDNIDIITLPGPPGPPGPAGTGYVHTQAVASNLWVIVHGLGYRPDVQVFNTAGQEVLAAITNIDVNTTNVTPDQPLAGTARLI
jgi:hypothetical protein